MTAPSSLRLLDAEIDGDLLQPSDHGFADGKETFYGEFNTRIPLAVVSVANATDAAKVVGFARDEGIGLAIRAGGHSILGHSSSADGLVLDLSRLKSLDIDQADRTAWAGGGLTAGEYTSRVAERGLITGFGDTASVGIAGITLGGGVGLLHRKLGLTIDSVIGAEIVTADGAIHQIDEENEPDLFWAIRGGGGNFGLVTRLRYRLHPLDRVVGGMMILPASPKVVSDFVTIAAESSDDLSVIGGVAVAPPLPFLPDDVHGQLVILALLVHAGEVESAEREVNRFRKLAKPLLDGIQTMRYSDMYEEEGGPPNPVAISGRSVFTDELTVHDAEVAIDALRSSAAAMSILQIRVLGGAVGRVPVDATAFAHRNRPMILNVAAAYANPDQRSQHEQWVTHLAGHVQHGPPGAYVNFHADDSESAVREIYPGATWERLVEVKTKYDHGNLFRSNHNIPPRD